MKEMNFFLKISTSQRKTVQVTYLSHEHSVTSNGIVLVTIPANKCKCLRERRGERESLIIIFNVRFNKLKYLNSPFGCNE